MTCPSRGQRILQTVTGERFALADYCAVIASFSGGFRAPIAPAPTDGINNTPEGQTGIIAAAGLVMGPNNAKELTRWPPVTFGSISDGSSNTALFIEKSADARKYNISDAPTPFAYLGETGGMYQGNWHTNGRFCRPAVMDNDQVSNRRSMSTNSLAATLSWDTQYILVTRNDGNVVNFDEF